MSNSCTVATLLTPPGKGGVAIISLIGPRAGEILANVFKPRTGRAASSPASLSLGWVVDGGQIIDEAIVRRVGESVEIDVHGGPAVARAVLAVLVRNGAAVADESASPSPKAMLPVAHPLWKNPAIGEELLEFLPRAQSPLVAGVLANQWSAGLSELACGLLAQLQRPGSDRDRLRILTQQAREAADRFEIICRLLDPPHVVLAGAPNVGKSTLLNALLGRQASIVNATAGTTRDWVRELALLDGVPVWLTDTAGVWEVADAIDAQAIARAKSLVARADLVLLLESPGQRVAPDWLGDRPLLRVHWRRSDDA